MDTCPPSRQMSDCCLYSVEVQVVQDGPGLQWAVLVAGSRGWDNYRHQADVCHAYQVQETPRLLLRTVTRSSTSTGCQTRTS